MNDAVKKRVFEIDREIRGIDVKIGGLMERRMVLVAYRNEMLVKVLGEGV